MYTHTYIYIYNYIYIYTYLPTYLPTYLCLSVYVVYPFIVLQHLLIDNKSFLSNLGENDLKFKPDPCMNMRNY